MSGFMKKMSSVASSAKASAKTATAKAGLAAGVAYNSDTFRAAFALPETEPLLDSFTVTLLSGAAVINGQAYLTPHLICLYTFVNSKEVKVKISLAEVESISVGHCANAKIASPVISPLIPVGEKPNAFQVSCRDGVMHTMLNIAASEFEYLLSILHVTWDLTAGHTVSSFPVPATGSALHEAFRIHQSEPLFCSTKASIITGTDRVVDAVSLFVHYVTFRVGDTPVMLELARVTNIARAASSPHPDASVKAPVLTPLEASNTTDKPKGVILYMADGMMHQIFNISDIRLFYNQLVYLHSIQVGAVPVFW